MGVLTYFASVIVGDSLYVSNHRVPELYKIDLRTGSVDFIGFFSGEYQENTHFWAFEFENKVFFLPASNKCIDIYDLKASLFRKIELPINDKEYTAIGSLVINDKVVIFPRYYGQSVWEISLRDEKIIKEIKLNVAQEKEYSSKNTMALRVCNVQNKVYFPVYDTNCLVCIDLVTGEENSIFFKSEVKLSGDIILVNDNLWIGAGKGILIWNPVDEIIDTLENCIDSVAGNIERFVRYKNKIIVIPHWYGNIKIIDVNSMEQQEVKIEKEQLHYGVDNPWRDTKEAFIWDNKLIITPVRYKETIEIDLITLEVRCRNFNIDIQDFEKLTKREISETEGDLDAMLMWLKSGKGQMSESGKKNTGIKIWNTIKEFN